jgi:tetratricopeptide (TPR) repeat protein
LASKGILFERAFAHNPTTLPSHANILLGTTPLYHGVHDNSKFKVADDFLTLAEHLKEREYSTGAFIGAFPLDSRFGLDQGFDLYDESYSSGPTNVFSPPERIAADVIESAIVWLSSQRSKWFSWIHLWDPHTMYSPPEPYLSQFKDDLYSGEVAYVDSQLGKLFDYLKNRGFLENTLIILTGDHGESLGEHGESTHSYFAYNSTIWVPLIVVAPGVKAGRIADYVCHIDIFPTVCDLLQIEKPPFLQGTSLQSLIAGKRIKDRAIYIESLDPYYNGGAAPLRGYIQGKKKFLDSPLPEYYDLETDFNEGDNAVKKIDLKKHQQKLQDLMDKFSTSEIQANPSKVDREALDKLKSLGYISSAYSNVKKNYGPEDDLKTLLPFQKKLDEAIVLFDNGRMNESIGLLEEIIQEKKDIARVYITLYPIYKTLGEPEKSLRLLEKGFLHNPENYEIVSAYGVSLIEAGKLDEGIEVFQKALALIDFDPMSWNYLGLAHWRKGEEQKALEYYRRALAVDATFAMTYANLGGFYFSKFSDSREKSDYLQAMEYFKKAIEYDPELALAYKWLGVGYKLVGRVDAAISVWEKARELDPNDAQIVFDLGKALLEKGNKKLALEYFEQYLRLRKDTLSPEERLEIDALIKKCRQK